MPYLSAQERTSCPWYTRGIGWTLATLLDAITLAIMVLGSEINVLIFPVLLMHTCLSGTGQ